jgi:inner membrane protein
MRNSTTGKAFAIGALILALIVPTVLVLGLVSERQSRRDEAVRDIQSAWSGAQTVSGPLLLLPVRVTTRDDKGRVHTRVEEVFALPDALDVGGDLRTETRHRGIYKTALYTAQLALSGSFTAPDFDALGLRGGEALWDKAEVLIGVSDLRGVKGDGAIRWAGRDVSFDAGSRTVGDDPALTAAVPAAALAAPGGRIPFALSLSLAGSQSLRFVPVGRTTTVALKSVWPSPAFKGAFLPDSRAVDASGFSASWKVLHINRGLPPASAGALPALAPSAFGVDFLIPVDYYASVDRAVKYAVLFVFLTFLVFFLIEFFQEKRLHPIQYLMVGAAVILFYVLLLSFSEQMPFPLAYLLASAAVVAVVGGYTHGVFARRPVTAAVVATLSGLYAYLYTLLRLEDYALLLGSLGLLAALALVMYLTRRFDWYALEQSAGT